MNFGICEQISKLDCDLGVSGWPDLFGRALFERCCDKDAELNPIRVLSLFSGAGGLDIGFHDANFEIVESVELEESFCATLRANSRQGMIFSGTSVKCMDVCRYQPDLSGIDFIIGGPPCQTFSAAGRRANGVLGTTDARGVLFKEYVRILDKLKPRGVRTIPWTSLSG